MTTYCEELGLKVGDKIRFIGPDDHYCFNAGDVLTLEEDDGSPVPCFRNQDDVSQVFCVLTRTWKRIGDNQDSESCDKQDSESCDKQDKNAYDKEDILNYLVENLTLKELLEYVKKTF